MLVIIIIPLLPFSPPGLSWSVGEPKKGVQFKEIEDINSQERCCKGVRRFADCRTISTRLEAVLDEWPGVAGQRYCLQCAVTVQGDTDGKLCYTTELG